MHRLKEKVMKDLSETKAHSLPLDGARIEGADHSLRLPGVSAMRFMVGLYDHLYAYLLANGWAVGLDRNNASDLAARIVRVVAESRRKEVLQ
jgi:hypothetical protein